MAGDETVRAERAARKVAAETAPKLEQGRLPVTLVASGFATVIVLTAAGVASWANTNSKVDRNTEKIDTIETKVDEIADIKTLLVRQDAAQSNNKEAIDRLTKAIDKLSDKIDAATSE